MASIIIELQNEALDRDVPLSDLLRKALVVARKLNIKDFDVWISKELEGYSENSEIPNYREMIGVVEGWDLTRGWQPILFQTTKLERKFTKRKLSQRIAELESLLTGQTDNSTGFQMSFSPEEQRVLSKAIGYRTEIILTISDASIAGVLDIVRNIILNWALRLEEDGVLGEGMTFSDNERTEAGKRSYNVNIFYEQVTGTQIQQGSQKTEQRIKVKAVPISSVAQFINALDHDLPNLVLEGDTNKELSSEVATLQAQITSPNPKDNIVRESLNSIRRILEGASGGAAAQLLIQLQSLF